MKTYGKLNGRIKNEQIEELRKESFTLLQAEPKRASLFRIKFARVFYPSFWQRLKLAWRFLFS